MRKKTYYINENNGWGNQHSNDFFEKKMTKNELLKYKEEHPIYFITDNIMTMYYYCND